MEARSQLPPGKFCPDCRQVIDAQASTCPWCHHRFGVTVGQVAIAGFIILAAVVVVLVMWAYATRI